PARAGSFSGSKADDTLLVIKRPHRVILVGRGLSVHVRSRSNPGHLSSPLVMHIAATVSTFALALKAFYFGE
ncbi:hypothetical protein, partial [Mesorhizobium silamurunense]